MKTLNTKKGLHSRYNASDRQRAIKAKSKADSVSDNKINLKKSGLFFPEGFEKLFIALYGISLPYLVTPEKPKKTPRKGTLEAIKRYNINQ